MGIRLPLRDGEARAAAKQAGAKRYSTGNPCPSGHVSERYTSTGSCCECIRISTKKQSKSGYFARRYRADKPRILEQERKRNLVNSADRVLRAKSWAKKNPEKVKEIRKRYKARRRTHEGFFKASDVSSLLRIQRGGCAACGVRLSDSGFEIDHIIPVCRGGTSFCGNLQLLCPACNRRKSSRLPIEFRVRVLPRMLDDEGDTASEAAA